MRESTVQRLLGDLVLIDINLDELICGTRSTQMGGACAALEHCGGNRSRTAAYLGIARHILVYRIDKYGLGG